MLLYRILHMAVGDQHFDLADYYDLNPGFTYNVKFFFRHHHTDLLREMALILQIDRCEKLCYWLRDVSGHVFLVYS